MCWMNTIFVLFPYFLMTNACRDCRFAQNSDAKNTMECCEKIIPDHRNLPLLPEYCGTVYINRIIGSTDKVDINELPWMALISVNTKDGPAFVCGGSIINDRYILTAAHCVATPGGQRRQLLGVRVGEHDLSTDNDCEGSVLNQYSSVVCADPHQDIGIENVTWHDEYATDHKKMVNDIALIRLKKPINFTRKNVRAICLPTSSNELTQDNEGMSATVAGWGTKEDGMPTQKLLKVNIPVHSKTDCALYYENSRLAMRYQTTTNSFICAGVAGKDSCNGDSGGPLIVPARRRRGEMTRYVQYGIVANGDQCGSDRPGLYTDVVIFMDWILDHLEQ